MRGMDQSHIRGHRLSKGELDDIAGDQIPDFDIDEPPVAPHNRGVADAGVHSSCGLLGAVLVKKPQSDAGRQDQTDDQRLVVVAEEVRQHGGHGQQDQHRVVQLATEYDPGADTMGADCVGAILRQTFAYLGADSPSAELSSWRKTCSTGAAATT